MLWERRTFRWAINGQWTRYEYWENYQCVAKRFGGGAQEPKYRGLWIAAFVWKQVSRLDRTIACAGRYVLKGRSGLQGAIGVER